MLRKKRRRVKKWEAEDEEIEEDGEDNEEEKDGDDEEKK